ncbi:hypothetical protein CN931_08720 [Bacillus sp. AFS054943]|uniref:Lipoprotein n=1 Tax=Bacillus cereus TaxID=1396 RepID=A0A2C1L3K5_BACCE|nr:MULTISPECIES: hypothetical protein [Bacillus]PGL85679.1 hypothetical protein CN931_08720 [Bacillus sp. AFS054943]PGT99455.1 hypothetical protein COD19_19235 [Bacillus cereus]
MKAKKIVRLAIPMMLLSGCITIETDGKKEETKKAESQSVEKEKGSKSSENKKEDSLSVAKGKDTNSSLSNSKPSTSSNYSSSSSSSTEKLSGSDVERYKSDIATNSIEVENVMTLIDKVAYSDGKSYSQKKSEIQLSLGGAKTYVSRMKHLQAPPELKSEQGKLKQSMELYEECFQLLFDAIEEESDIKLNQSGVKAQEGSKLFTEAVKSIASKTQ